MTESIVNQMDVLILCGGAGTRLRNAVNNCPKPMAMINAKPFLDILIEYFSSFGFRRFILCAGYMSEIIREHYENADTTYEIVISEETEALGTAGSIRNAEQYIRSDLFIAANGDSFCNADLIEFHKDHSARNALMSMVVTETKNASDYGSVFLDNNRRIIGFAEKDREKGRGYINAGIYLFNKKMLNYIPAKTKYSLEYELFPKLIDKGIYGFISGNELIDIGTPERLVKARDFFERYLAGKS